MLNPTHVSSVIGSNLSKKGYKPIKAKLPKDFTWTPDLLVRKKKDMVAVLIREANSIPLVLVQRIAAVKLKKVKLKVFISFCARPSKSIISVLKAYGLGVYEINKGNLRVLLDSKNFSAIKHSIPSVSEKPTKKMSRTDIFVSSQQDIEERKQAKEVINELERANRFPIYPILVEEDARYGIDRTQECIDRNIKSCDWFIGILAEQFRPIVDEEIRKAFKKPFKPEAIMIFVKASKEAADAWKRLLRWIEKQNTVKYIPYTDSKDLKDKIHNNIVLRISRIYSKLGVRMYG